MEEKGGALVMSHAARERKGGERKMLRKNYYNDRVNMTIGFIDVITFL